MAEATLKFFLQRLNFLLLHESEIIFGAPKDQIIWLQSKLNEIQSLTGDAAIREIEKEAVRSWVLQLITTVHDAEDLIDKFIVGMSDRDGSDQSSLIVQMEEIDGRLTEIIDRKVQLDIATKAEEEAKEEETKSCSVDDGGLAQLDIAATANEEAKEEETKSCSTDDVGLRQLDIATTAKEEAKEEETQICAMDDGGQESSLSYAFNFRNLPYYLRSSLMYCCIFPDYYGIPKGRLVKLLVAEGLVEEREGQIVEDTAKEYINKLVSLGMLQILEEYTTRGTQIKVVYQYRQLCLRLMEEENFVTAFKSSDTHAPRTARRVSIHGDDKNIPSDLIYLPIRSLFLFGIKHLSESSWDCLKRVFCGIKLLRVLDLEDLKIKRLPNEVGDLIHLRYLGLKKSDLEEVPETVSNLRNLQTLDIRWCGKLSTTALPSGVSNLLQLRHLRMFKNVGVCGMRVPVGTGRLRDLQTLTGLYAGGGIAEELGSLTQLRRLRVMDVSEDHASELYASIMKMKNLLYLKLEGEGRFNEQRFYEKKLPILDEFSPPPLITKLCLEGRLEKMPNWFGLMENITKLRLGFTHLAENPGYVLQSLPNLKDLCLWHAFDAEQMGREFCSAGGFPKLENLSISSHVLEEWTEIEEGAFPSLKYLRMHNCLKLRKLPEGLQYIDTLEHLYLMPLLDDHEQRLKPDGGEENYKIKHIPLITFITTSMVERFLASKGNINSNSRTESS